MLYEPEVLTRTVDAMMDRVGELVGDQFNKDLLALDQIIFDLRDALKKT